MGGELQAEWLGLPLGGVATSGSQGSAGPDQCAPSPHPRVPLLLCFPPSSLALEFLFHSVRCSACFSDKRAKMEEEDFLFFPF